MANSLKNTCKGFHFCSNTAGYRINRAVVCVRTDNNFITFFTVNQFCTINLHSVWYAAYLFLLFSTASVKLKQIQFVVHFPSLVFFRFFLFSAHLWITEYPYCNSLMCLVVLILEIIPKKTASWLFSICLLGNTSRIQCTQTLFITSLLHNLIYRFWIHFCS